MYLYYCVIDYVYAKLYMLISNKYLLILYWEKYISCVLLQPRKEKDIPYKMTFKGCLLDCFTNW